MDNSDKEDKSLLVLGVTGGIGSGKTTVCRHLETLGASVFYADLEAKRLMVEDPELIHAIRKHFGESSYGPDGSLNRAHLARIVFENDDQLHLLNSLVHPRVRSSLLNARERVLPDNRRLLVYEAALLLESGGRQFVDAIAVVHAPERIRIRRVVKRDSIEAEQVKARIQNQLGEDEMLQQADFVIENDGSLDDLIRKATKLKNRFEALKGPPENPPEWIVLEENETSPQRGQHEG